MFLTDLQVKKVGEREWELLAPLRYASPLLDRIIEVPAGFKHDFASVPRLPLIYSIFGNTAHKASVIHDWLYESKSHPDTTPEEHTPISRKLADDVFYEAVTCHHSKWRATLMWLAVRAGGGGYWRT